MNKIFILIIFILLTFIGYTQININKSSQTINEINVSIIQEYANSFIGLEEDVLLKKMKKYKFEKETWDFEKKKYPMYTFTKDDDVTIIFTIFESKVFTSAISVNSSD